MEWELEKLFPRKIKTGEEMQWAAERGKLMRSLFKTSTTGSRMKWELPSPVASSSPVVAKWQSLPRRDCRRTAASSGAPVATVIEEEGRTRTGTLASAATKVNTVTATTSDLFRAGVEVVTMIQSEDRTLIAAESGTETGDDSQTRSVTDGGTMTEPDKETGPGFEEVMKTQTDTEQLTKGILPCRKKAFQQACLGHCASPGYKNNLGDMFLSGKCDGTKRKRCIPFLPMKVLDAPGLKDDYYLNLVDWNAANLVAIALSDTVYLWHPEKGVHEAISVEPGYISSVAWIKDRNNLAIGTSAADVQLWDIETKKKLRSMHSHSSMVGALSWNSYILSSGSRFGSIHHHDVRIAHHHVGSLFGHSSQVCSLKWSPNGALLASGGNDGLLNIWFNDPGANNNSKPDMTINNHKSAVKAMNWCPWQSGILAVGGGMKDGHLRIWDTKSGSCIRDVDTKSQICSLLWLSQHNELITGHGLPKHQISVWNYPTLVKSANLKGHRGRVLHMASSPDGNVVFSAAADETVCLWNCVTASEQKQDVKQAFNVEGSQY
ncbi:cell division cycle protein 20 homolog isoform X2 [Stegostoma tigrinum]|uniref:cell division cycle protein 20 homolog isoform X2 n=1 Tax=Stegostoma tigrinum TaxID=3053191 RepID=UPI00202AE827|nr:cell division cycle protein 20 homolog isoform X2 [Stegostoma tigrinum]